MRYRIVLITGASRGIGAAVAQALADEKLRAIGLQYRSREGDARALAARLRRDGVDTVLLPMELGEDPRTSTQRLAETFLDRIEALTGGRNLHVLVNNAGGAKHGDFAETTEDDLHRLINLNLAAPLFLTQAMLPHIQQDGRVINVSTGLTRVAAPYQVAYVASKAALNSITLSLAPILAERNSTINAVLPGYVETERMQVNYARAGRRQRLEALSLFGRLGTPSEVAAVVRFLASSEARWITGQLIDATGGSGLLGGQPFPEP